MTAGAECVCNDVVRKVEIEDKCVVDLNDCDVNDVIEVGDVATVDGNGNGNSNGYVGEDVKDDTDDSSYVFVSGGVEVSGGDVDDLGPRSDSDDRVDQVKKEEFGSGDSEVKEDVNLENGSTVHSVVVLEANGVVQGVNGGVHEISGEEEALVKSIDEVDGGNEILNGETKVDDSGSGATIDVESTLNTVESSPVTGTESDSSINTSDVTITESLATSDVIETPDESLSTPNTVSNTNCGVMVNGDPESISNLIDEADVSGKPSEDLECQVTADGSKSSVSPTEEHEDRVTVDESGKPSEALASQVTADEPGSSVSPTKEQKVQQTVDESEPSEALASQVAADERESSVSPIEEQEVNQTVDESKPSEALASQVTADERESPVSRTKEQEVQQTVEESKPSEALASQVTADEPESFGSLNKDRECGVAVDESDPIGKLVDNQECCVSVESEPSDNHTEEVDGKSREHQELLAITSEINVEAEPNYVCDGLNAEHDSVSVPCQSENEKAERTNVDLSTESKENPDSGLVLSGNTGALANGQVEKCDEILEMGDTRISETEADKEKLEEKLEKQMEGSSETLLEVTEPVEIEANSEDKKEHVKVEDEVRESLIVATNIVEDDLNLEDNTTEPANEAEVPLKTETNSESTIHVSTAIQYEVSNSIDKPLAGFQPEGSSENIESVDFVTSECNSNELLAVKDNDSLSTTVELVVVEHVNVEDEIQESQIVATDIVGDDLNLKDYTTDSTKKVEVPLETEANIESVIQVSTASQYEVSNSIDKSQEGFREGSSDNIETVDLVISECNNSELLVVKDNDSLFTPGELIAEKQKAEIAASLGTETRAAEDIDCGSGTENVDLPNDDEKDTEVKDAPVEYVPHVVTKDRAADGMDWGTEVENFDVSDEVEVAEVKDAPVESAPHLVMENISAEVMDCGTRVENVDYRDSEEKEAEVKDASAGGHPTLSFSDTIVSSGAVIEFGSIGRHETTQKIQNEEAEDIDGIQSDEIPTSSVEGSVTDAIDVQNEVDEVLPYNFLIKIPRCEDENLRDQIRSAQLLVEEKTRVRDAIRVEIQGKRAKLKAHNEAYNAAKTEETAARRLVRLKRQEIDSLQAVINRLKNAMSVKDIDARISNMEHMIQHETLLLKDEKLFIREIKQLKALRDQLTSNMGSPEEIQQAIDQKDQNEECMKTLRKELESLKDKALKAEAVVKTAGRTYNEESRRERELQAQFRAADDVRQDVYAHLNSLKRLSYDKNKNFRQFKEDLMAARDFASHGNKDALHRLCANQVETFMEQWNNNDEFRKEYISRCNMNASRRQRALDGGPLVPDDVAPVLPGNVNEKADNSLVSVPGEVRPLSVVLPVEDGKIASSTEKKLTDSQSNNRSTENVSGQKNEISKTKSVAKQTGLRSDNVAVVTDLAADDKKEEENALTKEEIELAKKAEELKKDEIAAKLKEQRRLEEKAKAIEALERKKRNAEKAQIRAELRARKEAEQKEKEREKRLRKKEKKKAGGGDSSLNGEEAVVATLETPDEAATKEAETLSKEKTKKKTAAPPPHFLKQQQQLKPKPIPPPLVNRNRKRWQQWGKLALAIAAIFFLFMLGNTNYIRLKLSDLI